MCRERFTWRIRPVHQASTTLGGRKSITNVLIVDRRHWLFSVLDGYAINIAEF
jgi:hypothetical protein